MLVFNPSAMIPLSYVCILSREVLVHKAGGVLPSNNGAPMREASDTATPLPVRTTDNLSHEGSRLGAPLSLAKKISFASVNDGRGVMISAHRRLGYFLLQRNFIFSPVRGLTP